MRGQKLFGTRSLENSDCPSFVIKRISAVGNLPSAAICAYTLGSSSNRSSYESSMIVCARRSSVLEI